MIQITQRDIRDITHNPKDTIIQVTQDDLEWIIMVLNDLDPSLKTSEDEQFDAELNREQLIESLRILIHQGTAVTHKGNRWPIYFLDFHTHIDHFQPLGINPSLN